ncbi:MAG: hypothetical protein EAZ44_03035 [Cytophagia bacterium]|nr:MAG: hypothetical protein EAZ44_03035 [Cytophagia bacterium]
MYKIYFQKSKVLTKKNKNKKKQSIIFFFSFFVVILNLEIKNEGIILKKSIKNYYLCNKKNKIRTKMI